MTYDTDGGVWISESPDDFSGWEHLGTKFYKVGEDGKNVYTVYVRTPPSILPHAQMKIVFATETELPKIKNGMCL